METPIQSASRRSTMALLAGCGLKLPRTGHGEQLSASPSVGVYFMPACHSCPLKTGQRCCGHESAKCDFTWAAAWQLPHASQPIHEKGIAFAAKVFKRTAKSDTWTSCGNTIFLTAGSWHVALSFELDPSPPRDPAAVCCCRSMSTNDKSSQDPATFARGKRWSLSAASFLTRSLSVANSMTPLFSWMEANVRRTVLLLSQPSCAAVLLLISFLILLLLPCSLDGGS